MGCLIPKMDYKPIYMMDKHDKNPEEKVNDDMAHDVQGKKETIHTKTPGALLTISFHVKQADQILAYLYINGQYLRFMPEDIINILPRFFVESDEKPSLGYSNKRFVEDKKQYGPFLKDMQTYLVDKRFDAFVK